jgi:hypothetical protein
VVSRSRTKYRLLRRKPPFRSMRLRAICAIHRWPG